LDRWLACKGDEMLRPDAWPARETRHCRQLLAQLPPRLEESRPIKMCVILKTATEQLYGCIKYVPSVYFSVYEHKRVCCCEVISCWLSEYPHTYTCDINISCATVRLTSYDTCRLVTVTRCITLHVKNRNKYHVY
jgi:hypothetical protein